MHHNIKTRMTRGSTDANTKKCNERSLLPAECCGTGPAAHLELPRESPKCTPNHTTHPNQSFQTNCIAILSSKLPDSTSATASAALASTSAASNNNVHFCAVRVQKPNKAGKAMASGPGLTVWIVLNSPMPRHAVGKPSPGV